MSCGLFTGFTFFLKLLEKKKGFKDFLNSLILWRVVEYLEPCLLLVKIKIRLLTLLIVDLLFQQNIYLAGKRSKQDTSLHRLIDILWSIWWEKYGLKKLSDTTHTESQATPRTPRDVLLLYVNWKTNYVKPVFYCSIDLEWA